MDTPILIPGIWSTGLFRRVCRTAAVAWLTLALVAPVSAAPTKAAPVAAKARKAKDPASSRTKSKSKSKAKAVAVVAPPLLLPRSPNRRVACSRGSRPSMTIRACPMS
ncbi:hypothetical protein [Sphingomonas sp. LR55]|uniref:hypothetical protein n=1 Tax=Sphingomonas sp. LR55 TaxID=3050231 RepID=UPI002FE33425